MKMTVSYACKAGELNTRTGMTCQDYADGFYDPQRGLGVAVLADGAGSYTHSADGARAAAKAVLAYFYTHDTIEDRQEFTRLVSQAVEDVDPIHQDVGTTLLFVAATKEHFVAGHIGDGVILTRQKDAFSVLSFPENGEYAWETFLLPCKDTSDKFRFYEGYEPEGFILSSDGISSSLYEKDGSGCPACDKLFNWSLQMSEEEFRHIAESHFDGVFSKYSNDDKSIAVLGIEK